MKEATFIYHDIPQRTPEWYRLRLGLPTASRLSDLTSTLKNGQPTAAQKDYLKELRYEKTFGISMSKFVSSAMYDGVNYEDIAANMYSVVEGVDLKPAGIYANQWFAASPDRLIGDDGLLEVKVLTDTKYADVLEDNNVAIDRFNLQIQGQLWASGRAYAILMIYNVNSNSYIKIKIARNDSDIEMIQSVVESLDVSKFAESGMVLMGDDAHGSATEVTISLEGL